MCLAGTWCASHALTGIGATPQFILPFVRSGVTGSISARALMDLIDEHLADLGKPGSKSMRELIHDKERETANASLGSLSASSNDVTSDDDDATSPSPDITNKQQWGGRSSHVRWQYMLPAARCGPFTK